MATAALRTRSSAAPSCAAAAWRMTPFCAPPIATKLRKAAKDMNCEKAAKPLTGRKLADNFSSSSPDRIRNPKKAGTEASRPSMRDRSI